MSFAVSPAFTPIFYSGLDTVDAISVCTTLRFFFALSAAITLNIHLKVSIPEARGGAAQTDRSVGGSSGGSTFYIVVLSGASQCQCCQRRLLKLHLLARGCLSVPFDMGGLPIPQPVEM